MLRTVATAAATEVGMMGAIDFACVLTLVQLATAVLAPVAPLALPLAAFPDVGITSAGSALDPAARILARQILARCTSTVAFNASASGARITIELALDSSLGPEAFSLTSPPTSNESTGQEPTARVTGVVRVSGGDPRGVLFGVGKLLRTSSFAPGALVLGNWRSPHSAPAAPNGFRAMLGSGFGGKKTCFPEHTKTETSSFNVNSLP